MVLGFGEVGIGFMFRALAATAHFGVCRLTTWNLFPPLLPVPFNEGEGLEMIKALLQSLPSCNRTFFREEEEGSCSGHKPVTTPGPCGILEKTEREANAQAHTHTHTLR